MTTQQLMAFIGQRTRMSGREQRLIRLVLRALAIGWLVSWWIWLQSVQAGFIETDAQAYWGFTLDDLYQGVGLGDRGAFLYSPLVAQLFAPFSLLPYEIFYAILSIANLCALAWLIGFELAALFLFVLPISNEIARGNIHLLLATAIVVGLRYPAAWAWVILTKVTPGVGVLWFAARGEWRPLGVALGATSVLVAASLITVPDLWLAWVTMLASDPGVTRPGTILQVPVLPRIVVAVAIIAIAARINRPELLPVAVLVALPAIWINALAMLVAVIPIWRAQHRTIGLSSPQPLLVQ